MNTIHTIRNNNDKQIRKLSFRLFQSVRRRRNVIFEIHRGNLNHCIDSGNCLKKFILFRNVRARKLRVFCPGVLPSTVRASKREPQCYQSNRRTPLHTLYACVCGLNVNTTVADDPFGNNRNNRRSLCAAYSIYIMRGRARGVVGTGAQETDRRRRRRTNRLRASIGGKNLIVRRSL